MVGLSISPLNDHLGRLGPDSAVHTWCVCQQPGHTNKNDPFSLQVENLGILFSFFMFLKSGGPF